jgi:TRAP transporter TAXI family solute receptor
MPEKDAPNTHMNLPPIKLSRISRRDLLLVGVPALLIVVAAFWIAFLFVRPAPPGQIVMSTGAEGGAYHEFAKRYREILARDGVKLELRNSSGSGENLRRLLDESSGVEIAFIQSGTAQVGAGMELLNLGSVFYEPVWVFYRGREKIERFAQLRGRRIAIGPEGSGTRKLALQLLDANGVRAEHAEMLPLGGDAAAEELRRHKIDAMFIVAAPEAPTVQALLHSDGVRVASLSQAAAYIKRFQFLSSVVLPQGAIDLVRDIPPQDTVLLAPTANMVARADLHPAIIDLMMQALAEVHSPPGLFHNAHEFPAAKDHEFPLSREAQRFYKSGAPFLQRYLPFWAATLVDRVVVLLIPLLAVVIPVIRLAPPLYAWRIRSRLVRLYKELKLLEFEIRQRFDPARFIEYMAQLETIEDKASTNPFPLAFSDQLYTLRVHINLVRAVLEKLRPAA